MTGIESTRRPCQAVTLQLQFLSNCCPLLGLAYDCRPHSCQSGIVGVPDSSRSETVDRPCQAVTLQLQFLSNCCPLLGLAYDCRPHSCQSGIVGVPDSSRSETVVRLKV